LKVVVKGGEVDNPAWAAGAVEECLAAQAQAARDQRWRMCRSASGRTSSLPKNYARTTSGVLSYLSLTALRTFVPASTL